MLKNTFLTDFVHFSIVFGTHQYQNHALNFMLNAANCKPNILGKYAENTKIEISRSDCPINVFLTYQCLAVLITKRILIILHYTTWRHINYHC